MLGLVLSAQMSAEEQADEPIGRGARGGSTMSAEERIEAALDQPIKSTLAFTELPLIEIFNTLQDEYDIPIVFDNGALDEVAISPETEITVILRNITLRSALKLMLQQPGVEDLTYVIDSEVLLITTIDRAGATLTIRMHRVDDLDLIGDTPSVGREGSSRAFGGGGRGGARGVDNEITHPQVYSSLIEAIVSCVESDSWQVNGTGVGELVLLKPGILVVTNTRRVQDKVERFLDQLRRVKTKIEQKSTGSGRF
jgi:hypothetical protein